MSRHEGESQQKDNGYPGRTAENGKDSDGESCRFEETEMVPPVIRNGDQQEDKNGGA